jgi:hypothetical protein
MAIKDELGGNLGLVIIGAAVVLSVITAYMLIQGNMASWVFLALTILSFLLLFYFVSIGAVVRYISKVCTNAFNARFGKKNVLPKKHGKSTISLLI